MSLIARTRNEARFWQGRHVLVTGGGSGIGREIACQLHARGSHVMVASLLQAELDSLHALLDTGPGRLETLAIDLTRADAVDTLMQWVESQPAPLDVLINNAGTALFGDHVTLDAQRVSTMLTLNIQAMTTLAGAVARHLIAHGRGGSLLNVASIGAYAPVPRLAAYSASKHYVLAFSHALAEELAPHGIHVGALCPGITRTPIFEVMGLTSGSRQRGSVSQLAEAFSMAPEAVARRALKAVEQRQRVALPGLNQLVALSRLLPDQLLSHVMYQVSAHRQTG